MLKKTLTFSFIVIFLCAFLVTAHASGSAKDDLNKSEISKTVQLSAGTQGEQLKNLINSLSPTEKKLSPGLLPLTDEKYLQNGQTKDQLILAMKEENQISDFPVLNGSGSGGSTIGVYAYIQLNEGADFKELNPYVLQTTDTDRKANLAVCWVDINKLTEVASLDCVQSMMEVVPPVCYTGSALTGGDAMHHADQLRSQTGITGSGVKIGVISDGVSHAAQSQASGDLPADLHILSNTVGGDEGTAMLEIIYDMAPGATLYFHDCGANTIAFNSAIDDLVAAGCNIICDDIGWITEPFFEDGLVANHVKDVMQQHPDILFTSSAGNAAGRHFQGVYHDDGTGMIDKPVYFYMPYHGTARIVVQWDESFGAASSDYGIYIYSGSSPALYSNSIQSVTLNPLEYLNITNNGSGTTLSVRVTAVNAPTPKNIEVYVYPGNGSYVTASGNNTVAADSIFGHPAVPGVIACGAIDAATPDAIETFSSQGPVTMLTGTRQKPDICGADGAAITGAGSFPNPFYGTSAAAPHVAAIAALLKSRFPNASSDNIKQMLFSNVVDLGTVGYDNVYGNGRADALLAGLSYLYVNFDSKGGGSVDSILAAKNSKITPPASPTWPGHSFLYWCKDTNCTIPWNFATDAVTTDTILYAKWTDKCTITTASNNTSFGTVSGAGTYNIGSSVTVKAVPQTGYHFVRWMEGSTQVSTSASYTFTAAANRVLTAVFAINSYTIGTSVSPTNSGTVTGAGTYNQGSVVTVKAAANPGYQFVKWTEGGVQVSATASYAFTATKNRSLTAVFAKIKPPVVTAKSAGTTSIKLTWAKVTSATGYEIWRKDNGIFKKLKACTTAYFTDTKLKTGTAYSYKVKAIFGSVAGDLSAAVTAKPLPLPPTIKVKKASTTSIKISFTKVSGATGYEYSYKTTGSFKVLATITSTSYTQTKLKAGTTYYYRVRSYTVVSGKKVYGDYSTIVSLKL